MQVAAQLQSVLADRYRIEREIGRGAMAIVYLAHDLRHDRPVALKVLNPELGALVGADRFLEEIRVTAHLQHPNLLPLFDSGEAGGLLFYVMPYVDGESLRARLDREKQLPIDEAVHIAVSIAGALEYAHAHGVIHRDLKPENILLQAGQPMVADFGIALAVSRAAGSRMTESGISLGTPAYMSPEQATGDRSVDARTDVYSLAAVLYEMLTGDPPHLGSTVQAIIAKVMTEPVPSVRLARPNVPEPVADAIARGLEKLPADRWLTAREFGEALIGGRLAPPGVASSDSSRHRSLERRRALVRAASFTAAGALLGIVAGWWLRPAPVPQTRWMELPSPDSVEIESPAGNSIAMSPDGSLLAFIGTSRLSLFVRRLDQLLPRSLPGTEDARCPFFSPDGRWILFSTHGHLSKVPVAGGPPVILTDSADLCGVWTERNEVLFSRHDQLYSISAEGGPASLVVPRDSNNGIGLIAPSDALPGGRAILVEVSPLYIGDRELGVVTLPDGRLTVLTRHSGGPRWGAKYAHGYVVFHHDGIVTAPFSLRHLTITGPEVNSGLPGQIRDWASSRNGDLAYVAEDLPRRSLVGVTLDGRVRTFSGAAMDTLSFAYPRISPDGRRVVLELNTGPRSWDLYVYELASGTLSRLTESFRGMRPGGWSADGRSVLYVAPDEGKLTAARSLVSQVWDGSEPPRRIMRLPANAAEALNISVGPPHTYLAMDLFRSRGFTGLLFAPLDSPEALRPLLPVQSAEYEPRISPDGKLLAYVSTEMGHPDVYVRPLPGPASHVRISLDGGEEPVWSRDGQTLFYRGEHHLMRALIARSPSVNVVRRDTLFADTYERWDTADYDVFPDSKELLLIKVLARPVHAGLVLNWPEFLRRQAAAP